MSGPLRDQTGLVVDGDIGFLLWLGKLLADGGIQAVPALSCEEAVSRIRQLGLAISVAIVSQNLSGASHMLRGLRRENRALKIVLIRNPEFDPPASVPADAILDRPIHGEPVDTQEWVRRIRKAISSAPLFA